MSTRKKAGKSTVKRAKTAKPATKKVVKKSPAPVKKSAPKKALKVAAKKPPAKKAPVKKPAGLKAEPKKPAAKSPAPKAPTVKKASAPPPKKAPVLKQARSANVAVLTPPQTPSSTRTSMLGPVEVAPYQPAVNEEYMSAEQLDHFRLILNQWKEQLMLEVDSTVGHMKEEAILYPDPLDRAAQEEGFNLELRTRDRERRLIKKIEISLDKIDSGEYGFCASCGTEIGLRRLEARPTADKCIDCKTFEEIREKQSGL